MTLSVWRPLWYHSEMEHQEYRGFSFTKNDLAATARYYPGSETYSLNIQGTYTESEVQQIISALVTLNKRR